MYFLIAVISFLLIDLVGRYVSYRWRDDWEDGQILGWFFTLIGFFVAMMFVALHVQEYILML